MYFKLILPNTCTDHLQHVENNVRGKKIRKITTFPSAVFFSLSKMSHDILKYC